MTIQERIKSAAIMGLVIIIGIVAVTFGVGSYNTMPDYAGVVLAHTTKTYVPLPCVKKWERTPGRVEAELATAGEARKLRYRIEDGCQEYLMGVEQTLGSSFLRDKGFLAPTKEWWDQPYRTDKGMVYPGKRP